MELSETARERLADIVELQPTKNGELQERWGMESGSEVHQYLEGTLGEYYFRDEKSLIRATEEAAELVDVKPGVEGSDDGTLVIRVQPLARELIDVLPGPEDQSMSVVSALEALRASTGTNPAIEDVREAIQTLRRKGVVEVVYRMVPTYRLARSRDEIRTEAPTAKA